MNQSGQGSTAASQKTNSSEAESAIKAFRGVRYQVKDVSRSIDFYTRQLGFKLEQKHLPAFGEVSVGDLKLILSGPGASGSRPMPDGDDQSPGGWNRIVLQVTDLQNQIDVLKAAGVHLRNDMEVGPGGKQIQLEDPDGNPIELLNQISRDDLNTIQAFLLAIDCSRRSWTSSIRVGSTPHNFVDQADD